MEGTVIRNAGHHAFVPHMSNGFTFRNTIAYDVTVDAYWWDPPPHSEAPTLPPSKSEWITYDKAVAAKVYACATCPSPTNIPNSSRLSAFELTDGSNNTVKDSVAVGVQGVGVNGGVDHSGFEWPEGSGGLDPGVWNFDTDNRTHNNRGDGIFVWQNVDPVHPVENFVTFHNGDYGVDHGAYKNNYHYEGCTSYGNANRPFRLRAGSRTEARTHLIGCTLDGGGRDAALLVHDHNLDVGIEVLVKDTTLKNAVNGVWVTADDHFYRIDLVCVTFEVSITKDVHFQDLNLESRVRIQSCDGTTVEQIDLGPDGKVRRYPIAPFWPY